MSQSLLPRSLRARSGGVRPIAVASALAAIATLTVSGFASAQQNGAGCPPGSWFCESTSASGSASAGASAGANGQLQALPPPDAKPAPAPAPAPASSAPPVVVYQPGPPVVVVQGKPDKPAPYPYTQRDPDARPRREWGLNLHFEGAMIGQGKYEDSGMGGLGMGLRFRPHPVVAIQPTIDFYGGRDYNGQKRGETAFALNTLLFATPHAKVVQLYFPIGFGWSGARVENDRPMGMSTTYTNSVSHYSYFGMQAGIGLEFRLARHFALNTELRGFVRGRTDSGARANPEFVDGSRTTNTSGGGLFALGMTFYF